MVSAMSDLFQSLADAPAEFVAMVADVLERRAADPEHQAIVEAYVGALSLPDQAAVLEIGCGTGAICRHFAGLDGVARVRGIDPAPGLIACARDLALDLPGLEFRIGRGEATGESAESYDIVVLHTVLSHVADPAALLAEARRVLRPEGTLVVCDSDFSQASAATNPADPLQACVEAWAEEAVADRWLVPRLPRLLEQAGFVPERLSGHSRVDRAGLGSGPAWIDYGIGVLVARGRIGAELGDALRAECRRRIDDGEFFAVLPFVSMLARKAATAAG